HTAENGWGDNPGWGPMTGPNGEILWTPEQLAQFEDALLNARSGEDTDNWITQGARESYGEEEGLGLLWSLGIASTVTNSQFRTDTMQAAKDGDNAARTSRAIATAGSPTWVIANQQWHNIGTPEQQAIWDTYWDII